MRQYIICETYLVDNKTKEKSKLNYVAFILQAGKYWWVKLFWVNESRKFLSGPWEKITPEKLSEISEGNIAA